MATYILRTIYYILRAIYYIRRAIYYVDLICPTSSVPTHSHREFRVFRDSISSSFIQQWYYGG